MLAVLLAAILYGGYRMVEWPGFHLQRVIVSGNAHVPSQQIVAAVGVPANRNLWLVPLGPAAARVEAIPWIDRARLSRIPPATLRVRVSERAPAAVVALPAAVDDASGYALVDAGGRILERANRPAWTQPIVRGIDPKSAEFPRIIADLRTLSAAGVRVRELDVLPLGELAAVTYTRLRLDLGDDSDLARKASLVNPIIARLGRRVARVAALDLRAPRTPVVVYR
ncbi:MAG: FtsQ-type POTRA domain-containing protein [bacterium]|nr:FtsQ-type POTRA domain-containing protein [bacterium]